MGDEDEMCFLRVDGDIQLRVQCHRQGPEQLKGGSSSAALDTFDVLRGQACLFGECGMIDAQVELCHLITVGRSSHVFPRLGPAH
jgi:hypothetical protein